MLSAGAIMVTPMRVENFAKAELDILKGDLVIKILELVSLA